MNVAVKELQEAEVSLNRAMWKLENKDNKYRHIKPVVNKYSKGNAKGDQPFYNILYHTSITICGFMVAIVALKGIDIVRVNVLGGKP